jgi:hypothetical protein
MKDEWDLEVERMPWKFNPPKIEATEMLLRYYT